MAGNKKQRSNWSLFYSMKSLKRCTNWRWRIHRVALRPSHGKRCNWKCYHGRSKRDLNGYSSSYKNNIIRVCPSWLRICCLLERNFQACLPCKPKNRYFAQSEYKTSGFPVLVYTQNKRKKKRIILDKLIVMKRSLYNGLIFQLTLQRIQLRIRCYLSEITNF